MVSNNKSILLLFLSLTLSISLLADENEKFNRPVIKEAPVKICAMLFSNAEIMLTASRSMKTWHTQGVFKVQIEGNQKSKDVVSHDDRYVFVRYHDHYENEIVLLYDLEEKLILDYFWWDASQKNMIDLLQFDGQQRKISISSKMIDYKGDRLLDKGHAIQVRDINSKDVVYYDLFPLIPKNEFKKIESDLDVDYLSSPNKNNSYLFQVQHIYRGERKKVTAGMHVFDYVSGKRLILEEYNHQLIANNTIGTDVEFTIFDNVNHQFVLPRDNNTIELISYKVFEESPGDVYANLLAHRKIHFNEDVLSYHIDERRNYLIVITKNMIEVYDLKTNERVHFWFNPGQFISSILFNKSGLLYVNRSYFIKAGGKLPQVKLFDLDKLSPLGLSLPGETAINLMDQPIDGSNSLFLMKDVIKHYSRDHLNEDNPLKLHVPKRLVDEDYEYTIVKTKKNFYLMGHKFFTNKEDKTLELRAEFYNSKSGQFLDQLTLYFPLRESNVFVPLLREVFYMSGNNINDIQIIDLQKLMEDLGF